MTRKLLDWFLRNVLLGAIPLITEIVIRWSAGLDVLNSEKNIPELMFLVAMINLGTADDVERAKDLLDETDHAENELRESLTNWHNILMFGMVIGSALFGGYLVVDTLGTANKVFLPHLLAAAWIITGLYFALANGSKSFHADPWTEKGTSTMTLIKVVEYTIYGLAAFGIGAALYGIWSIVQAFSRKQYLLLGKRFDEKHDQFLQRKQRVDQALRKK